MIVVVLEIYQEYGMKKVKAFQPFLSVVIFLFILVFLAYFNYDSLTGVDFLPSTLSYQNFDEESPLVDSLNKSNWFTQSFICFISLRGIYLSTQPLLPDPQTSFVQQRTPSLRC
jgi:hypothetical protein